MNVIYPQTNLLQNEILKIERLQALYEQKINAGSVINSNETIKVYHDWYKKVLVLASGIFGSEDSYVQKFRNVDNSKDGYALSSNYHQLSGTYAILLDRLKAHSSEVIPEKKEEEQQILIEEPHLFICHSGEDSVYAKAIIELIEIIGLKKEQITCTSEKNHRIKNGRLWDLELKEKLKLNKLFFVVIHSSKLYESPVCMNELGAAWVRDVKIFHFFIRGFKENNMLSVIPSTIQGTKLGNGEDISDYLDDFKDKICDFFNITSPEKDIWGKVCNTFMGQTLKFPKDQPKVNMDFDLDTKVRIHIKLSSSLDEAIDEGQIDNISWKEIMKTVGPILSRPTKDCAIFDILNASYKGIAVSDIQDIINQLHENGLVECYNEQGKEGGVSTYWVLSGEGRRAYERACNYKLKAEYRERDERLLKQLMGYFSTSLMDEYLREGPYYLSSGLLSSSEYWFDILMNSAVKIYDETLEHVMLPFYTLWNRMMSYPECYDSTNTDKYRLYETHFGLVNKEYEDKIQFLHKNMSELKRLYAIFIQYVKDYYPQIDLLETSHDFEINNM